MEEGDDPPESSALASSASPRESSDGSQIDSLDMSPRDSAPEIDLGAPEASAAPLDGSETALSPSELLSEITRFRNALFDVLQMHYSIVRDDEYEYPFLVNDRWYTLPLYEAFAQSVEACDEDKEAKTSTNMDALLDRLGYTISGECSICLSDATNDVGPVYETLSRALGKRAAVLVSSFLGDRSVVLRCGHCFHARCFRPWVAKHLSCVSCPLCRERSLPCQTMLSL